MLVDARIHAGSIAQRQGLQSDFTWEASYKDKHVSKRKRSSLIIKKRHHLQQAVRRKHAREALKQMKACTRRHAADEGLD
mmetsp:Transcript_26962/g.72703  ORF Transcript_26962/g.72703 Transcript_26962/m.72703 type:complete len:80 (+) Transcript_26962:250-489(+)